MKTGIITECYADTLMLKIITRGNPNLQHQRGCNKVSKTMQEKYCNTLAIGIIDYDKKMPPYMSEFTEFETFGTLKLYKHPTNLPPDLSGLRAVTKSETSIRNADLERFYKALVRSNADSFSKIAQWITDIENKFK